MSEEMISVIDIASKWNKRKQSIFKIIKKLGIPTYKERNEKFRGQEIAYILIEDEVMIDNYQGSTVSSDCSGSICLQDINGVFYLIQLEPTHDPGRFKVGFTNSIQERIRSHKCSAPLLRLIDSWPCKSLWEKTAIDCVTAGCERIHTESFPSDFY